MKTTLLITAIAAGVTLAAGAQAKPGDSDRPDPATFMQLDADGNGALTPDEISTHRDMARQARIDDLIETADANADGVLQTQELTAHMMNRVSNRRGPDLERMFNRMDADNDGMLTAQEFEQERPKRGHRDH